MPHRLGICFRVEAHIFAQCGVGSSLSPNERAERCLQTHDILLDCKLIVVEILHGARTSAAAHCIDLDSLRNQLANLALKRSSLAAEFKRGRV
jgi:hypothetical protein